LPTLIALVIVIIIHGKRHRGGDTAKEIFRKVRRVSFMKITVESLGLPTLSAVIGKKTEVMLEAGTVAALVRQLSARFGPKAREVLLDGEGQLDLTIQVMLNEEGFISREELRTRELKDGDRIRFMLLVGGG
jgi:molybdopterin converting factor small subunit